LFLDCDDSPRASQLSFVGSAGTRILILAVRQSLAVFQLVADPHRLQTVHLLHGGELRAA
jgi:hypothetical protein